MTVTVLFSFGHATKCHMLNYAIGTFRKDGTIFLYHQENSEVHDKINSSENPKCLRLKMRIAMGMKWDPFYFSQRFCKIPSKVHAIQTFPTFTLEQGEQVCHWMRVNALDGVEDGPLRLGVVARLRHAQKLCVDALF